MRVGDLPGQAHRGAAHWVERPAHLAHAEASRLARDADVGLLEDLGTEILQQTDIRIAGESARFGVSEVRWSLYPMGGSAVRLRRQIPYTHAAEILLTGKHLTAEEAARVGLIGHVVPDGQALAKAKEIAATIAQNGPIAVEAVLRTLRETDGMTEAEALAHEWEYGLAVFQTNDGKEGPRAFAEKRPPNYTRT